MAGLELPQRTEKAPTTAVPAAARLVACADRVAAALMSTVRTTAHHNIWRAWLLIVVSAWMSAAPSMMAIGFPISPQGSTASSAESSPAPSVCIYLYANAEPIMGSDPSGKYTFLELEVAETADATVSSGAVPVARTAVTVVARNTVNIPLTIAANILIAGVALRLTNGDAIIGETTERVVSAKAHAFPRAEIFTWDNDYQKQIDSTAQKNGVLTYDVLVVMNYMWIQSVMARCMIIWDIGIDDDRNRNNAGRFYELEQMWTNGYPLKRKVSYPGHDHLPKP